MTCTESVALGAYVLGALEPEERRRVEEHLRTCPACAEELADFAGLPDVLARVRPEDLHLGPVQPSPQLFDRVRAAAAVHHRRRRLLAVAAAAVVVLGVVTGVVLGVATDGNGSRTETYTASQGRIQLAVATTAQENGTALDVTVRGMRPGEQCRLFAVDDRGRRHAAGEWWATYGGDGSFRGWTEVDRPALTWVLLLDQEGEELVRLRL